MVETTIETKAMCLTRSARAGWLGLDGAGVLGMRIVIELATRTSGKRV